MTNQILHTFIQQIADLLIDRMETGQSPFQRVETGLCLATCQGRMTADLVLWINQPNQIAGSLLLFPEVADEQFLSRGRTMARAIGLGHFVTWEARQIRAWTVESDQASLTLPVPGVGEVRATDFLILLERLLGELKFLAVKTTVPSQLLAEDYFLNICLRTVDALRSELDDEVRRQAGTGHCDEWVAQEPTSLSWLCLWRVLTLLALAKMPQPSEVEKIEQAALYALSCLDQERLRTLLAKGRAEPAIGQAASVRLHHLVCRLKQLGWPHSAEQVATVVNRLLERTAADLNMAQTPLPWTAPWQMAVNCHAGDQLGELRGLIAPRPYLAGVALLRTLDGDQPLVLSERFVDPVSRETFSPIVACPIGMEPPSHQSQQVMQIELRRHWPNRRFDLPRNTPRFLWETLSIAGLQQPPAELCLLLPATWHHCPGADTIWEEICSRYRISALAEHAGQWQALKLSPLSREPLPVKIIHGDQRLEVDPQLLSHRDPAILHLCLQADQDQLKALTYRKVAADKLARFDGRNNQQRSPSGPPRQPLMAASQVDEIIAEVFHDGFPSFPDDYLRDYYRPDLLDYPIDEPLTIGDRFFDRVLLVGKSEHPLEVNSLVKAEILCLASYRRAAEISIPADDSIGAAILAAYRRDLQQLWQNLQQECRCHQQRQQAARNLANRIWRKLSLPPAKLFLP
ncbi:MAG: hypothetical protein C0614_07935 [Desulfuromonas sp.]|nr:MAG: hypothetical protein C0614_07935 [Desulfuromonas sp.]